MAELADALDLGSSGAIHAGSIPVIRTRLSLDAFCVLGLAFSFCLSLASKLVFHSSKFPASEQALYRLLRFFTKIRARSRCCSSFSAKDLAPFACSFVNALTTAPGRYYSFAVLTPCGRLFISMTVFRRILRSDSAFFYFTFNALG